MMRTIRFNWWRWPTQPCIGPSATDAIKFARIASPPPTRWYEYDPVQANRKSCGNDGMRFRYCAIMFCLVLMSACNSRDANAPATSSPGASPVTATSPATSAASAATSAVKANIDVCGLLTADDLKSVQGEAYKEAMRSDRQDGDFIVAQCYYSLPTTTNSVVLNVTTAKPVTGAPSPRAFWETTFGKDEAKEKSGKEREKEKEVAEKKTGERGEENEAEAPKPQKINGLGDEAFWLGSRVGGALYVLKKDQFFRISVGGAGDENSKLNKSKTLAQRVFQKL